ncbi:PDDEXK nuclease domain-containing protein [Thiothrix unzii]|jgi:predicted nuclease of restriction endonuclease-like (RecB) superfamily|uniref:PDDEXK nuclease domain-containing protein n=1 Tax=Thiothrix unzii TaxID=111769 RepID=UPI002A364387|nr:PDDEXK nuclease domain-containing protein [Thiothrix unzii]MDX9988265.1 PDDEXK nuclease domain-containing protein [Thiothrix unzii]
MNSILPEKPYDALIATITSTYDQGRLRAVQAVNVQLLETYWQIGRHIVEFEQAGSAKAGYGKSLIKQLATDLTLRFGKGFSRSNLVYMRQLYKYYPKSQKPSHQLSWSHYVELLKIDNALERGFYEKQAVHERWSVPELKRQKNSALFLRLAASTDKEGILRLAQQGQLIEQPGDLLREPYVFEFLKIPEPYRVSELQLETLLCDHLQQFLLELSKGFTYVGRQYRITLNNTHYKVDLVFYHRILRCFVLIDLKINEVQHHDIGQMNLYLGYFANEENIEGDNPPIGIILSRHKDELLVEYATYQMNSQLFVQKYQLYLPNVEDLRRELGLTLQEAQT